MNQPPASTPLRAKRLGSAARLRSQLQMTIFFTTHYMEEAAFSDAICVLDHGHILLCDTLDRIETAQQTSGRELDLNALYLRLLGESR